MKESIKHMLQGAAVTAGAIFFCVGAGFMISKLQTSSKQEIRTRPELSQLKEVEVITTADAGERVQTRENHSPVPITTFCFRKVLHMQVNQGNATWGSVVFNSVTGKPEKCGD